MLKPIFLDLEQVKETSLSPAYLTLVYDRDFTCGLSFLKSYSGNPRTFNSYRSELEKYFQWAWYYLNKSILHIDREQFESFLAFCETPPKEWISLGHEKRLLDLQSELVPNPKWKPFLLKVGKHNYKLSQTALKFTYATLRSFYNFLVEEGYTERNPAAQIRQKSKFFRKEQTGHVVRRLTELQWGYLYDAAKTMADADPVNHERTLFIISCLFGMYLRISELVSTERWTPEMGNFQRDVDGHWWFKTVGKGNKARQITVSDSMLEALKRYRKSRGLSPLPTPYETTPLILTFRGNQPITSTQHIRRIVQTCFDKAKTELRKDGFEEEAEQFEHVTVHWLRHTGISEDVKSRPREHVRDDAGHGSSAITDKYIDIELRARHASGKKKTLDPDTYS